jgi:hypothetical protein
MNSDDGGAAKPNLEEVAQQENKKVKEKRKKKRNLWPLKAMLLAFVVSFAVNVVSELALDGAALWLAYIITVAIIVFGVFFDTIGTASTACELEPFLSMASRKVKGAKIAVKLCKDSDRVSSICNDIIGDITGIVSGICAASIALNQFAGSENRFWLTILVYALVSTLAITLKAFAKRYAVTNSNQIIFATARFLSIFVKEG